VEHRNASVTGASGAGKTTVHPHLVDALTECAVFDVDYLLDSLGHDDWRRFRDAWLSVAHAVAGSLGEISPRVPRS
jgi:Ni2+-binding GTPase involved in maturation of urease and hydrogenase